MAGHLFHLLLFSAIVATYFGYLVRREPKEQLKLAGMIFGGMVGGTLLLAYLMFPFPR